MKEKARPYKIRGHHLHDYKEYQESKSPTAEQFAREQTMKALQWRLDRPQDRRYYDDILGKTPEDALKFYSNQRELWETYHALPKDAAVKLVSGQRGEHCNTCIVGDHCTLNDPIVLRGPLEVLLIDAPDGTRHDTRVINAFRKTADSIQIPYTTVEEMAIFTDAPPKPVESVIVRAGDFKKVLETFDPS